MPGSFLVFIVVALCALLQHIHGQGTAIVREETELLAALRDVSVQSIIITNNMSLTAALWPANSVNLARPVYISAPSILGINTYYIDQGTLGRGAIRCDVTECDLKVTGPLSFTGGSVPPADFSTPVPMLFGVGANGKLELTNVEVISASPVPTSMWNASNLVWQPSSWWAGNITYYCQSTTEVLFPYWRADQELRERFLLLNLTTYSTGYIEITNGRMSLSQSWVCSQYNFDFCNNMALLCNSPRAVQPLATDVCATTNIQTACRPIPPLRALDSSAPPPVALPVPRAPSQGQDSAPPASSETDGSSYNRIALILGLALGLGLGALCLAGFVWLMRAWLLTHAHTKHDSLPVTQPPTGSGKQPQQDHQRQDTYTNGYAAASTERSELVKGRPTPVSQWTGDADVRAQRTGDASTMNGLLSLLAADHTAGFSYHSGSVDILDDLTTAPGTALGMAQPHAAAQVTTFDNKETHQLTRNPLGVVLTGKVGQGAYGLVYSALWKDPETGIEQTVAVKVIKQNIAGHEDLEAILQLNEAQLGKGLQHPRIVATLAYATVLPDGLLDANGVLVGSGTAEAHIISRLCDLGTLRQWMQRGRFAQSLAGRTPTPSRPPSKIADPVQAITTDATAPVPRVPSGSTADRPSLGGSHPDPIDMPEGISTLSDAPPSGTVSNSGVSGTVQSSVSQPLAVYPPLACMPPLGSTGLRCHQDFEQHLVAVVDILLEIIDGLRYLAKSGVVHGDLKPQNCLCCTDDDPVRGFTVKISDFGISRQLHGSKSHTTVSQPPGTLSYFAPELMSTCHMSPVCDIYSLGILAWELVTCQQPFMQLTMAQVLYSKATGSIDEHLPFPHGTPPALMELARACWSLQAVRRPRLDFLTTELLAVRASLHAATK